MDVCVVRYRSDTSRVEPGLRPQDSLLVIDNSRVNRGFARAANLAASQGDQEIICFVNTDGDLSRDCVDKLERALDDPEVVAADPDIGEAWNLPTNPDGSPSYLSASCLVVRREAFEQVGGFDERFFMYGEDVDLSWKLRKLGRLVHVADAHFAHDPDKNRPFRSLHRVFCNWHVVYKRHEGSARIMQNLRDARLDLKSGRLKHCLARLTGTLDYLVRAHRWV
jgi:GT2 family glycosyltransferase